jgi:predicted NBD/HSP70 family sugar kinase
MTIAVGIDIGGTGIKGAVVDIATGELLTERMKIATPAGGSPSDILDTVEELFGRLGDLATRRLVSSHRALLTTRCSAVAIITSAKSTNATAAA